MNVRFDENIQAGAEGLIIGYAVIGDLDIVKKDPLLNKEIKEAITTINGKYSNTSDMYAADEISGMRTIFREKGFDPTRYRPSAEALLKRVIDGKDLYRINVVVDSNNLGSMKFGLPMGVYNLEMLIGDEIVFRFGNSGEQMETMAKGQMNMENMLLSADLEKAFGSPVSDSTAAKIAPGVKSVLLLVYGPPTVEETYVKEAIEYTADKIALFGKGTINKLGVETAR